MSIIEKLGILSGDLKTRECKDDAGDYERKTYDILNVFPWGSNIIAGDLDNPQHANLFCLAPELLENLIVTVIGIEGMALTHMIKAGYGRYVDLDKLYMIIEKVTGKSWEEIRSYYE